MKAVRLRWPRHMLVQEEAQANSALGRGPGAGAGRRRLRIGPAVVRRRAASETPRCGRPLVLGHEGAGVTQANGDPRGCRSRHPVWKMRVVPPGPSESVSGCAVCRPGSAKMDAAGVDRLARGLPAPASGYG